jgi:hypothetical protein
LKTLLRTVAAEQGWNWTVELVPNPRTVIEAFVPTASIVPLASPHPPDRSLAL